jgi:glutaredoxin
VPAVVRLYVRAGCPHCKRMLEALDRVRHEFADVFFEVIPYGYELHWTAFDRRTAHLSYTAVHRGPQTPMALAAELAGARVRVAVPQIEVDIVARDGSREKLVFVGWAGPDEEEAVLRRLRELLARAEEL